MVTTRTQGDELNVELRLERDAFCGARARRCVEEHLGPRVSVLALEDVKLVVTELLDNAYEHGAGTIVARLRHDGDRIHVEVIDEGSDAALTIRHPPHPERGEGGWGLWLVDAVSVRWGAFEGTTHVWAELRSR